ncbi:hypothetical protein MKX01_033749, partial [Papaver californicum]
MSQWKCLQLLNRKRKHHNFRDDYPFISEFVNSVAKSIPISRHFIQQNYVKFSSSLNNNSEETNLSLSVSLS